MTILKKLAALFQAVLVAPLAAAGEWERLQPLPDKEGFASPFAGVTQGRLIVAGGANFPGKKPWEGGQKVWTDSVFILDQPQGEWILGGKLARPLGYGVSVTHGDGVVCVGGGDAQQHYADAFRLAWSEGKLISKTLPSLPITLANGSGALVGDTLYLAGGQERPDSTTTSQAVWRMDLSAAEPHWEAVEACPGSGRMLAVAAGFDGSFWLIGGVDLYMGPDGKSVRRYLTDGYRYTPRQGWKRIADVPRPVNAAPSPAPFDDSGLYILGGDDGTQVGVSPDKHRGFNPQILRFDLKSESWVDAGELPAPRVTVPCVSWRDASIVPSGEMRPGIRSPEIWAFKPQEQE